MVVRLDEKAKKELRNIYNFILKESPHSAEKTLNGIIDKAESLAYFPERYPLDTYKIGNDGSYRFFIYKSYRVHYRIMKDVVLIVRIRHTKQYPLEY